MLRRTPFFPALVGVVILAIASICPGCHEARTPDPADGTSAVRRPPVKPSPAAPPRDRAPRQRVALPLDAVRAIWVTRFDYRTVEDIERMVDDCAQAGFNTVLFQVRGDGTVAYPSRIEPWSTQFGHRDPGFDPLAVALDAAHRRGLALHAWVNVMPGWRGPDPPPMAGQLYNAHPDWFWYDASGRRQPLVRAHGGQERGWYVSVNPCLPEVRGYLVELFREVVTRYPVDGLHLDYIRFPNESVIPGEQVPDYPRDPRTLAAFHQASGTTPDRQPAGWQQWRTAQVSRLVADIHRMMRATRPDALLSAAVAADPHKGAEHFQDARRWLTAGWIDLAFLMNYTPDVGRFRARLGAWLVLEQPGRIVPGLSIQQQLGAAAAARCAAEQLTVARASTGHFSIFAYRQLFDVPPARTVASQTRALLQPHLAALASTPQRGPRDPS